MYKPIRSAELVEGGNIIKQGEHFTLSFRLFDADGKTIDVTGKTVTVKIANKSGVVFESTAKTETGGIISISVNENIGYGKMRIEMTLSEGEILLQKYPADGWIELQITPSLDDMGVGGVNAITVETLRSEIRTELNAIVTRETDSDAMSRQAAVDTNGVDKVNLKRRLDDDYSSINAQLADKDKQLLEIANQETTDLNRAKKPKPIVSFVDDDGFDAVWSKWKPIADEKGIPLTLGIISDNVGLPNRLTQAQLLELQSSGWEIASHYKTHLYVYDDATEEQIETELRISKRDLIAMGFKITNVVYPGGLHNERVRRIGKKYYKAGLQAQGSARINIPPYSNMALWRIGMDKFIDTPTAENPVTNTDVYYKKMVDKAVANNGWVIFMTHCYTPEFDANQEQYIRNTIDYIQSLGVDIVTVEEGLKTHGNMLEAGDFVSTTSPAVVITPEGHFYNNAKYGSSSVYASRDGEYTPSTPIEQFPKGKITITQCVGANAVGAPDNNKDGTLTTYNIVGTAYYAYQEYRPIQRGFYKRYYVSGAWGPWIRVFEGNKITKSVSGGAVAAKAVKEIIIYDTSILGSAVIGNPVGGGVEAGITWSIFTAGSGALTIRFHNTTEAVINMAVKNWDFFCL